LKYIDIAIKAAKKAGNIHKKYFGHSAKTKRKSKSFDLVTAADIEAEKNIVSFIKKHFPDHNFLAEEHKYAKTNSDYTWIIDPLDGTNNFFCGIPIFSVSIALAKANELLLGVIYDVAKNELFFAEKTKGAFLNGKRINVNSASNLSETIIITGFYYNRSESMVETLEKIKQFFFRNILGLRRFGAASLDLCNIACGRAGGYWEFELNPWDFCAGKLIVEEAGGKISDRYGKNVDIYKKSYIVASNKKIHNEMVEILKQ